MGVARVHVTAELLTAVLRFPAGTRIVKVEPVEHAGDVLLTVTHADLKAGDVAPIIRPTFGRSPEVTEPAVIFVGWGQD